jgi:hypothetical protein
MTLKNSFTRGILLLVDLGEFTCSPTSSSPSVRPHLLGMKYSSLLWSETRANELVGAQGIPEIRAHCFFEETFPWCAACSTKEECSLE